MTPTQFRQALVDGRNLFGTLIVSASPRWPEAVRGTGIDFVFIDTEHIALDRNELSWMCQVYAAHGLPPIVRIPAPDPYAATMVLDGGAAGIIAPYVETVEQVQALRGAVKLRPLKGRKLHGVLQGAALESDLGSYIGNGAANRSLIINVESVPAMEALDDLLAVPGLDGVLIGPHDLSCSLGIPERYDHPDFIAACTLIFKKARAAGIGAGIHSWGTPEEHGRMMQLGANLLIQSADILLFQKYLRLEIKAVREAAALDSANNPDQANISI
jgi:2-keto-3-deoxy-L-rhamnonate aldolase RhmA